MDETGLFFRDTTRKSYHFKDCELAGGKRSKDRITVSLCASMTGEKLQPLVIAKSANPRCFKRIKPEKLPVLYRNNRKAWMTTELMTEWLKRVDRQMRKQGRQILLFLDNAPSHLNLTLGNIKLAFLPANTTALAQPMDQGIIQFLKLKYRKRQLQYVLTQMETTDRTGSDILKQITVLDAIYCIHGSWKETEPETIQKCFAKCGFTPEHLKSENPVNDSDHSVEFDEEDVPLAVFRMSKELFGVDFKELVDMDDSIPVCDNTESDLNWDDNAKTILQALRDEDSQNLCDDDGDVSDEDLGEKKLCLFK